MAAVRLHGCHREAVDLYARHGFRLANVPALTCGRNDTGGHAIRARPNERRARSEPAARPPGRQCARQVQRLVRQPRRERSNALQSAASARAPQLQLLLETARARQLHLRAAPSTFRWERLAAGPRKRNRQEQQKPNSQIARVRRRKSPRLSPTRGFLVRQWLSSAGSSRNQSRADMDGSVNAGQTIFVLWSSLAVVTHCIDGGTRGRVLQVYPTLENPVRDALCNVDGSSIRRRDRLL